MAGFGNAVPGNAPAPARLAVGIVSAGRVGSAVGYALERRGHVVTHVVARSERSRELAATRVPEAQIASAEEVARSSELLVLAVPDTVLPGLVDELVATGAITARHIVVHTAGAMGCSVLAPAAELGAVVVAAHPAMTFTGTDRDLERFDGCPWGVTATDDIGLTVGQMLVMETGGIPVTIAEEGRGLYHAALAHGANHLVTLVNDALDVLRGAIDQVPAGGQAPAGDTAATADPDGNAERVLGPLLRAALDNALAQGDAALTGPVMRGDLATVARHLDVLEELDVDLAGGYRALAQRTAARSGRRAVMAPVLEPEFEEART